MAKTRVLYVPTLDVEPLGMEGSSGPPDWTYGEKSVRDFDSTCAKYGQHVTYFIHPEALLEPDGQQVAMFKELAAKGAVLGLHLHPLKWSMFQHNGERFYKDFGDLTPDETRSLLTEHIAIFEKAFGYKPRWFSPGTFSFNDFQYAILEELGFEGGRCSIPGRVAPNKSAVWAGAVLYPHYAHAQFRMKEGELNFVEMPLSVDTSRVLTSGGIAHFADLRIDADWSLYDLDYLTIARHIVAQLKKDNPAVPVINFVAHNDEDYGTPSAGPAQNLRQSLEATAQACEEAGFELIPATIAEVAERVKASPPQVVKTKLSHGGWMGKTERKK